MKIVVMRIFSGMMLALLLVGFLPFPFLSQSSGASVLMSQSDFLNAGVEPKTDWERVPELFGGSNAPSELSLMAVDGADKSARFIVGVDTTKQGVKTLNEAVFYRGGNVTSTISVDGRVQAFTVSVPRDAAFLFSQEIKRDKSVRYVELDSKANASFVPNDPYWSLQWGPKKIEADMAWNTTMGSSDILVAIIDTGIDYTHNDLAANYVPLGFDWVNGDNDPIDDNGHGTHCAGIVAARIDNDLGIAGLAQVRVMAEKVLTNGGWGYYSWVTEGIYHAVDSGARIISLSLGGTSDSESVHEAVRYAYDRGVLVVVAAGNLGSNTLVYPAAYDEVVAVSATDSRDNVAYFSSFGKWIDLSAPGVDIFSTLLSNTFGSMSGTSMACPHVTGVAALVWSMFPNSTASRVRQVLQRTADDLGAPGFDEYYGYGRVNARRAVAGMPEHDVSVSGWKQSYRLDPGQVGTFNVTVSNYGRSDETDVSVQFLIDEALIDAATVGSLQVDASASLVFSWHTTTEGVYNVTCYVVRVPGENVTGNNVLHAKVAVRFITVLRVPSDYSTIKAAINDAYDGDTISVSEGDYVEGQIDIFKDNLTLIADGCVTLDGRLGGYVLNIMADYVRIDGFDIRNSTTYGINVEGFGNIITRNTIVHNTHGVRLYECENSILIRNLVASIGNGIDVSHSSNNDISQNRLVAGSFYGGLNLLWSSNNTVTQNTATGGILCGAIFLYYSENNFIASNNLTGNRCGLSLVGSPNNVLRNNVMTNNWCNFAPWSGVTALEYQSWWVGPSDVDTSNTVDGKPIYYWVNVHDKAVPSDAGCVVLVNCENIIAESLDIKNNYNGILMVNSSNILIRRNNITDNWANWDSSSSGVLALEDSYNVTITQNSIMTNSNGLILWGYNCTVSQNNLVNNMNNAILLDLTHDSVVTENNITGHQGNAVGIIGSNCVVSSNNIMANLNIAIYAVGSNHTIVSNNIIGYGRPFEQIYSSSHQGIMLAIASNCTVSSNNIVDREDSGVVVVWASDNTIFHNNFVRNSEQFFSLDSVNAWDNGYPSGGNYWSSYSGIDQKNGPYQDQPGPDGIGDTPKILDANNTDRYPLMNPCLENPPPQTCLLTIRGAIDGGPITGFYNTPYPRPGTYIYPANSTIRVDTHLFYNTYVDHWELDGVNVGSDDYAIVLMNKDHELKAVLSTVPPLKVSINPATANIDLGESVTLTSSVSGGRAPYQYQWYLNGKEILGETSTSWTFTPKKLGTYYVSLDVRYPFSTPPFSTPVMSDISTINVGPVFEVSISPTSTSTFTGESISFVSDISSQFLPYRCQWYLNNKPVADAKTPAWTFVPNLSGNYLVYLKVTDSIGIIVKSNEASVTVAQHLGALILPKSAAILIGESISFTSVVWGGFLPRNCQWYVNDAPISGATSDRLIFTPSESGDFSVSLRVVDNLGFAEQSNLASITVREQIVVSIFPAPISAHVNQTIEFTSNTSGGYPQYNYQWYLDNEPVSGAQSSKWTFTPTKSGNFSISLKVVDSLGFTGDSNVAVAKITILGDLNRDHRVDIQDLAIASKAFGSSLGYSIYNRDSDINEDGRVDIQDLALIAKNFGKTDL